MVKKQLGESDPSSLESTNYIGHQVYSQLLPDFPATAIQWVLRAQWEGPEKVPLSDIDFSNRENWTASHEPKKVNVHMKLIKEGVSKPLILVKLPGHDKLFVADAHHRLLAYEAMDKEPVAYVGRIHPSDTEACTTMHSKQLSGPSKLDGT